MATCSTCEGELGKRFATIDGVYLCLPCVLDLVGDALWKRMLPEFRAAKDKWAKSNIRKDASANRNHLREAKKLVVEYLEETPCPT